MSGSLREGVAGAGRDTSGMSLYVRPVSISRDADVNYNSVGVEEGGRGEGVQGVVLFIKRQ